MDLNILDLIIKIALHCNRIPSENRTLICYQNFPTPEDPEVVLVYIRVQEKQILVYYKY